MWRKSHRLIPHLAWHSQSKCQEDNSGNTNVGMFSGLNRDGDEGGLKGESNNGRYLWLLGEGV